MSTDNLILLTDSYKASHYLQYPPNTTEVYSYFESRGGKYKEVVFFGLQYLMERYLSKGITQADINEAKEYYGPHMGMDNLDRWQRLLDKHGGKLPIEICAVQEGTSVPNGIPLITVRNTDPEFYWLTNYIETLLVQVWYPITVATRSREMKKTILQALKDTGDPKLISFKLHDFGCRGSTSMESAAIGGAAHLVNFLGTDTVPALHLIREYYGEGCAGLSIPAAEHSTITSWGKDREADAYKNMLNQFPGMVAVVSDSYDIYHAVKTIWPKLIRDSKRTEENPLVIRPDSGDPCEVLPKILNILGEEFGTYTVKGQKGEYKMVNAPVRIIQGDGITEESIKTIIKAVTDAGWSMNMLAFGSGGGLLQTGIDRDTCKFAFKCSAAYVDNDEIDVFKSPATDSSKRSKAGKFNVLYSNYLKTKGLNPWLVIPKNAIVPSELNYEPMLHQVFLNGTITNWSSFALIRKIAEVK